MTCDAVSHIFVACLISAPGVIFFGAVIIKTIRDRIGGSHDM